MIFKRPHCLQLCDKVAIVSVLEDYNPQIIIPCGGTVIIDSNHKTICFN